MKDFGLPATRVSTRRRARKETVARPMKLTRNIGRAMHELDCADTGRTSESQHRATMTVRDGAKGVNAQGTRVQRGESPSEAPDGTSLADQFGHFVTTEQPKANQHERENRHATAQTPGQPCLRQSAAAREVGLRPSRVHVAPMNRSSLQERSAQSPTWLCHA